MAVDYDPRADYYVTLGIEESATQENIKSAHRSRIRDLHPDHGGDSARATAVNLARDVLGDPSTRRAYDRARRAWFMAMLKDPTISAFFDRDGRHAAHLAA
ncbi:MAG: DnaJ domain-containing protein, partial [bacterium]